MTKEIIKNSLSDGVFDISLHDNGICQITMSYERDENNLTRKSMSDLHDLRSRAHLIISSNKKHNNEEEINYADFIEQVNLLTDIEDTILRLQSSGYIKYQNAHDWLTIKETKHLEHLKNSLREELDMWEESLRKARQQHYYLNYYWSNQLCVLYNFFTNPDRTQVDFDNVMTLIQFVRPNIDKERLWEYRKLHLKNHPNTFQVTPYEIVSTIGNALDEIFACPHKIIEKKGIPSFYPITCNASVEKGKLYVAVLDEGSPLTVNVMLTLYKNTTNRYPEPCQTIFCSPETVWEEVQIFLRRCFTQSKCLSEESLFCLANVELLTNEVQFELVDFIKKEDTGDSDYQLALICRGGDHHHIVEEFSKFQHSISGISKKEVSYCLTYTWPDVKIVTSTLPGLGKTEFIHQDAQEKGVNVVTFPISGQIKKPHIIHRLKQLALKDFQCLHFDIGEVDDPVLLDTFLFQLMVTGMVSCGTQLYSLPSTPVYIEIANSLNDGLRESLVITQCFTCDEREWKSYDDLEVSGKITSDIQVVCQYLDALERGRLEEMDIRFAGPQKVKPLPTNRCRVLLRKYYSINPDPTFTTLNTFLGLLADQLRKFSKSAFFEIENLKLMLDDSASGIRSNLLDALLKVSGEFAARSMKSCSSSRYHQQNTSVTSAQDMVQRVEGMIQWEESNHLLVVFHGVDSQTIGAFYRDINRVPRNVSDLLKSQIVKDRSKELDDFGEMSHKDLHEKLERIARTKSSLKEPAGEIVEANVSGYALTPDNMLKMILIILRVRANVPVIIMGETGCGKTSLVEYLAKTCQIPFETYNFHAGLSEKEIKDFIENENNEARKANGQRWVFLDEINTCHHLGLINEIMCHHTLYGRPLSNNLVLLAACNPYKLRAPENATTAGLKGEEKPDEYSKLVYRVHQLPEAMVDYVWDYGSLTTQDEKAYIKRMVQSRLPGNQSILNVFAELLAKSQEFIRQSEMNRFCVSLRDVGRCILLVEWFIGMIKQRAKIKNKSPDIPKHLESCHSLSEKYDGKPVLKSIVLALAHCYLSRLQTELLRRKYIASIAELLLSEVSEDAFPAIVRMEQEDYLDRMELPPGTARNSALRENVFVMLVSILNRIPVFVVGKPGCSKSLAIQLIRSNLRGKDSKDPFFKTLPHLYVVSYQGSKSSTSEGIKEIFQKASNYKSHNRNANVLPVVLLDEVGLAENSPNNPLKVLHSILEPGKGKLPDVAVVGISNWALDAAKMNRAIHLSRPEPTEKDLAETAISLFEDDNKSQEANALTMNVLNCLANAYYEYQSRQGHANFHGLRDYYSLIKSLRCNEVDRISVALQRNFGGIPIESSRVEEIFIDKLKSHGLASGEDARIPVTTLIQENLNDLKARHLMLITNGDSAIGILKQNFSQTAKETISIIGSRFEEDISDDYNYRMLSRIILCMERDCVLILRDLECIYGSLYDMLNQNYSLVGKRKNCRVALGANSNPMCYVNDGFRCIVLVDYDEVDYSDPPFLNRFEKQLLRFSDVLDERQGKIIAELRLWVRQMSSVEDLEEQFKESDMFMGFHDDTLPSLVVLHSNDTDEPNEVIVKKCKDDLMWIATPDGVLRTQRCERLKENSREVEMLAKEYFDKPIHDGLTTYMTDVVQEFAYSRGDEVGSKIIVMTYATVHTDINQCLNDATTTYQLERLGAYKSEKQLEERIHNFFFSSDKEWLVLQCKPELDGEHMLLARSVIEDKWNSYAKGNNVSISIKRRKNVCILVHIRRGVKESTVRWQFNFLSGWKQVFLDALDVPSIAVSEMRNETIDSLLTSQVWPFRDFAVKCILWCFSRIHYTQSPRRKESILEVAKKLFESDNVTAAIQKLVVQHACPITDEVFGVEGGSWQVKVACNLELLLNSSTLSLAMEQYLSSLIQQPLAKIVYFLERENAWPPHLFSSTHEDEFEEVWCDLLLNSSIFNINEIPECLGTDSYSITGARLDLRVPFSQVIFNGTHAAGSLVMEEYIQAMENEENFEENGALKDFVRLEQLQRYAEIFRNLAPSIHKLPESCLSSYMADIFEITSADFNKIDNLQHTPFSSCAFLSFAEQWLPIEDKDPLQFYALLHLFVWTSRGKVLDILELVACCQSKLPVYQKSFNNLTKDFFSAKQFLLPVVENELIDERFDMIWTNTKSTTIYSHGGNSDSKASHSRENDDYSSSENESDENTEKDKDSDRIASNEDEEIYFEDILVHFVCKKMFPSEKTVVENGGLDSWIQNCYLLLQLARKVDKNNPAYLFLRFCFDYTKVVQTTGISREYQYVLSRIANKLEPKYLEADNSFQIITEELIEPVKNQLRGQEENFDALQKFLSQFYSCCAEVNVETRSAASVRLIFENVLSLYGEKVFVMTPVIYRLLFTEEVRSPGIFLDIIITKDVNYNHSYLSVIDDVFKKHVENGLIHHDSYPAVMICDLIHFIQNFEQCFKLEHLQNSDSKLLKCFRCATNVVTESEDNSGLVLLSSVAFLRAFYRMLSKQPSILITGTPYSHVMSEINSLLATGGTRRLSIQIFFLKQLYAGGMSMFDLHKLCCDSDQLPVLKNLLEQCKIVNKAEFVSVYRLAEYDEVKTAYQHLTQKNEGEMFNILSKCKNSANHRFALLGILINMFYVKKAAGNLSEKEERLVDWFCNHSKDLPSPLKELMIRIVGRANFNHRGLRISLASSTDEIETALLILHIACVVASCGESEISPLLQYFITPEKCHGTCTLVHSEGRKRRIFDQFILCNKSRPATCTCGLRVKHKHDQERYLCPYCGTEIVGEECEPGNLSQQMNFYRLETNTEWEECTDNMDTSVYRALDLIVFACFYAGVATGISSNEAVSSLLRPGKEVSTGRRTGEDIVDVCFDRIKEDLKCLMIILSCQSRPAVDVMHLVVEKCTNLIQGQVVNEETFSAMEECLAWENKFTEIAEDILPSAIGSARPLSEMFKDSNKDRSSIENEILELDEYPSDSEQQNEELKMLFRLTKEPSFTELRSIFLISSKDFQEQHSLLSVLFSMFDEVSYLACLYPLLQWSRLVSTALTHRISRKEAESKFINDFIDGHRLQQERTEEERHELNKSFRLFRDAWNRMRDFVNKNLDSDVDEMPHLADDSFIGYCLTDGDLSVYLRTAIKILQAIQNNILDELIIKSARTENPALSFLQKSETCYAIMSVSLQEAKDKHIIKFDWSDKFLKYAQNPDYGVGEQIDYDFEQMEIQLANEIVLGKCFLTDSLNPFIFSKELFHSSAKILEKIHEICPQSESLPEDIRKGLHSLNEKRKQDAKNLLQHIEVVIYLLNMKSISSEEARVMTLEKFAETWKTKLPSPFPSALLPEPKASIKLTHIAALYEALEDLLADGTIKGLPSQFRKQLTEETIGLVNGLVDSRNGLIKLKQFLTALRRFVFRYLSAEKFLPEPHTSLRSCLNEPSLWSPDEVPDPDVIPREIILENIYALITHLQEGQRGSISTRIQGQGRNQLTARRRGKRRLAPNFTR